MMREQFLEKLSELLETPLSGNEQLSDLESWNSLAAISFLALANEDCGVVLGAKDLAGCETVEQLLDLVAQRAT